MTHSSKKISRVVGLTAPTCLGSPDETRNIDNTRFNNLIFIFKVYSIGEVVSKLIRILRVGVSESDVLDGGVRSRGAQGEDFPAAEKISICEEFLDYCLDGYCPLEGVNNSYAYKCAVQDWVKATTGGFIFIPNGAFIVAALRKGWEAMQECEGSPNCVFNFDWEK